MNSIEFLLIIGVVIRNGCSMHLEFTPKDPIHICVDDTTSVILTQSDNRLKTNTTIGISAFADIVEVSPSLITVQGSISQKIEILGLKGGYTTVKAKVNNNQTPPAYLPVIVSRVRVLKLISDITGWIYFISWSISYYPQMYTNYSRKSVVGLNFDYAALNVIGFILYSTYNCAMYFSPAIQSEYFHFHPKGMNPVMLNDVIFSVHAFISTSVIIYQCFIYERGTQKVSWVARVIMILYAIIIISSIILAYVKVMKWLEFILYCSYIKLSVTMIKYIPQAIMNYSRKSTVGWSIENVLLDFIGGIFSMLQMVINSYNYDDWDSIFGDPTKFGLGLFSALFDIFFMYQHYILYRNPYDAQVNEVTDSSETPESSGRSDTHVPSDNN